MAEFQAGSWLGTDLQTELLRLTLKHSMGVVRSRRPIGRSCYEPNGCIDRYSFCNNRLVRDVQSGVGAIMGRSADDTTHKHRYGLSSVEQIKACSKVKQFP